MMNNYIIVMQWSFFQNKKYENKFYKFLKKYYGLYNIF